MHVMWTDHIFSRVREDPKGKETEVTNKRRLLWVSMNISRNSVGVNILNISETKPVIDDFDRKAIRQTSTTSIRRYQSSLFIKRFFQSLGGFIAAWNFKRQYLVIYNKTSAHIIRNVILNCHVTDGWGENCYSLNPLRCKTWSTLRVCHWKCIEFYSLLLARSQIFIYIKCICKLN